MNCIRVKEIMGLVIISEELSYLLLLVRVFSAASPAAHAGPCSDGREASGLGKEVAAPEQSQQDIAAGASLSIHPG